MYRYLQRISRYEVISFTTGFALMAYELAAARILAPSIGSSTYVWTSVIGVIIAALALGYAVGGKVADARVRPLDVAWLLLASTFGVSLTLTFAPTLLELLGQGVGDPRLQGLFASLLLFAPASFVLGMVSPYLVRLRVASLATSGESVALLSALNSIGGIAGTFVTGFIFFNFIGVTETIVTISALLLASSWLVLPKVMFRKRLAVSLLLAALALLPLLKPSTAAGLVTQIETPSTSYRVFETHNQSGTIRFLSTGPSGFQSGANMNNPNDLVFDYTRKMAEVVAELPQKENILILGGGAFTLPEYLAKQYPASHIDVVEIDPQLENIARQYFDYSSQDNVTVFAEDARAFLNTNEKKYDAVLVDVYSDTSIPFTLVTQQYAARVQAALAKNGVVVANIIGANSAECAPVLEVIHAAYKQILPQAVLFGLADPTLAERQNIIGVYGQSLEWLDTAQAARVKITDRPPLTDNFAPMEHFQQRCQA